MSRDANGNYSLPAGNPVAPHTVITVDWANPTMNSLAAEITNSLSRNGNGGMLAPLKNTDGSAAAPSSTFTADPQSGMYLSAAGDIRFSLTGTDVVRINAGTVQLWDSTNSIWYNLLSAQTAGGSSETQTVTGGATVIPFTKYIAGASIYLNGAGVDQGRLLITDDYTYNATTNEVTLLTVYPDGTKITALVNDESDVVQAAEIAAIAAAEALDSETAAAASETAAAASETSAEAWAESPTAPGGVGTKSSKTWAGESKENADRINTPVLGAGAAGHGLIVNDTEDGYRLANVFRKNYLINANLNTTIINQRGFAGGQPAAGVYGYDRWKGDATATRIEQVVENTETINRTFTISWEGGAGTADVNGVTGLSSGENFTLNTSGNFSAIVPTDATYVQLEEGPVETDFEHLRIGGMLALCQRYYQSWSGVYWGYIRGGSDTSSYIQAQFPVTMRAFPTVTVVWSVGTPSPASNITKHGFSASTSALFAVLTAYTADSEL